MYDPRYPLQLAIVMGNTKRAAQYEQQHNSAASHLAPGAGLAPCPQQFIM